MNQDCRTLTAAIEAARRAVGEGHFVDLAGLDIEIATLCANLLDLPLAQRAAAALELTRLRGELDALSGALDAQNEALRGGDDARKRASEAYGAQRSTVPNLSPAARKD